MTFIFKVKCTRCALSLTVILFCTSFFAQKKYDKEIEVIGALYDQQQYEQTITTSLSYLEKNEKKLNAFNKSVLRGYIGLSYLNTNNYSNAEKYLLEAIKDVADSTEDTRYRQAEARYYLAALYNLEGRYADADILYRQALPLLAAAYGQSSKEYCRMFKEYAQMYVEMGKFEEAYPMINAAIYFYRTLYGEKDKEFLKTLNDMGRIYQGVGNYQYASLYFDSVLTGYKKYYKDEDPENYAILVNNAGENYRRMGDYEMAEMYLTECYNLSAKYPLNKATALNNLGLVYKSRGMFMEAERAFNEAINHYTENKMDNTLDVCNPWNGLGDLYRITGRFKQAAAAFQKVVNIREGLGGTYHTGFANVLTNIALTYADIGQLDEAERLMKKAYEIYLGLLGEKHEYTANAIFNLGAMREHAKDYEASEKYKLKAIEIYKSLLGEQSSRYASYLSGIAVTYMHKKQFEKSLEYFNQAEKILRENFGGNNYEYYDVIINKAGLYREMKDHDNAAKHFITAIGGYKLLLKNFFPYMNEDEKMMVNFSMSSRFETFADYVFDVKEKNLSNNAEKLTEILFDFQLFNKSSLLNESAEFRRAVYASNNQEIIEQFEYFVELKKYIGSRYRMSEQQLAANGIHVDSLEMEAEKIEKNLNTILKFTAAGTNVSWKEIASVLDKKSATIEIVRVENYESDSNYYFRYGAMIVKSGTPPRLILFPDGTKMDEVFLSEYRKNIDEQKQDLVSWNRYWKPIDEQLKGIQHIYFCGDGVYQKISLNSLFNPVSKKYLIEEKDIHLLTNLKDLLHKDSQISEKKEGVFFGYPDYEFDYAAQRRQEEQSKQTVASRFGFGELTPLPGTKKEVKDIQQVFTAAGFKAVTFLTTDASEKKVKEVKAPLVLHIATHGFFLPDVKTNDKKIIGFNAEKVQQNPLLRSGLMMAGASVAARDTAVLAKHDEDGILTAYEASFMNLQGTELVVLSACQTGLGETFNSQGVYGLQRSFLVAGAKSLIMSMWSVDDYATQELMVEFYKEWLKNPTADNKYTAFKSAQLKIKEKYKHPFYWSAFVLVSH